MRAWLGYALTGAGLVALLAGLVSWLVGPRDAGSVWWAAGVAYVAQLIAFGALLAGRRERDRFLAVWAGGIAMRLLVVAAGAFWVIRSSALSPAPALLGLAGFLFVLLLLEPLFFLVGRRDG